jgi:Domain of unknown function DUF11
MRSFHAVAGLVALGIGLVGWATLSQAQPKPSRPAKVEIPGARPQPIDDPFEKPIIRNGIPDAPPTREPVRVLDRNDPAELPPLPPPPDKSGATKEPVKPVVFIPKENAEPDEPRSSTPATRQESSVTIEWFGPTTLKVGTLAEYTLVARNTAAIPLHKVIAQVKVPTGAKVIGTEPKSAGSDTVLLWDLGTLQPGKDKSVKVKLVPPSTGEMICSAWVTVTGSNSLKVQVREPKLQLAVTAPAKAMPGDPVAVIVAVSNPGDHPAEGVLLALALGAGLEMAEGVKPIVEVGAVPAGKTREFKVPLVARTAGTHKCDVSAEGEGGLKAAGSAIVSVVQSKLNLEVTGPKLRYLDRKALYSVKVTNPGDAPAAEVAVSQKVPDGFKFASADAGGKFDAAARTIRWVVGEIAPGASHELKCELIASSIGDFNHAFTATAARGVTADKSFPTRVEGLAALAMEVSDSDDPVEVGSDTTYEIRVTNTGSKDETDVKLICAIPPQMKFKAADGPGKFEVVDGQVTFDSLKRLPARGDVIYKVTVTAKQKGDTRFKATLTAGGLTEPVTRQESTRVYSD